jgi:cardiolipin synthase
MWTVEQKSSSGTQFQWLPTVDESMEAMLGAIRAAKDSVRLEMYIFAPSPIGERFRDALVDAAQRGVTVRVLLDSWGSITLPDRFWDGLRRAAGQVRWFNPLSLGRYGIRDHRKLLVCDDTVAFVGGFNISSEYQGDGVSRGWHDLGLRVEGYFAQELANSFETLFGLADFQHRRFAGFRKAQSERIISRPEGQIILGGPGHGRNYFKSMLRHDVRWAHSVRIIAAYFLPARPLRRALMLAARRGCQVQVIVGAKSDVPLLQLASRRFYQAFLRAGIELYEYQPQILHAKLIIADSVVYVGSANLDRRSFLANYELMLRLVQGDLAAEARQIFDKAVAHSVRLEKTAWKKSRSFWSKLKERWAFFFLARLDPCLSRRQLRNLR